MWELTWSFSFFCISCHVHPSGVTRTRHHWLYHCYCGLVGHVSTLILYRQTRLSALFLSLLLILREPSLPQTPPAFYLLFLRLLQVPLSSETILRVYMHLFIVSHPGDCVQTNMLPCKGFPRSTSLIQVFPIFTANQHSEISIGKRLMGPAS